MERSVKIAAAAVLAAVAVLAALLAADVGSWRHAVAQGDALYAVTPGRATWKPPTLLGGAAARLLGTKDDVALRRGLQLYAAAAAVPDRLDTADELQSLRAQAQQALVRASTGRDASQAETLLGALAFGQSAETAIANFTNAVRADPTNAAAKFDLELLLRQSEAHGSRAGASPGGAFGKGGRRGAGGGVPGNGY
jgi:hypothetical protein